MDSLWTEYEGERYHVLGIAITDPELVGRTKRVIRCCIGLMGVLIIRTVILLMINEPVGTTLLSLLFNVSIPAFGYLGARDGSSSLMCIFVALMILNAANAIAVLFMVGYAVLTGLPQKRADGTFQAFEMTPSMWVQVFLIFAWALMALIAAYHANKLFNKLATGEAVAERYNDDPEIGLPEIDTKLEEIEPDSFGLPMSATRRNNPLGEEMDDLTPTMSHRTKHPVPSE